MVLRYSIVYAFARCQSFTIWALISSLLKVCVCAYIKSEEKKRHAIAGEIIFFIPEVLVYRKMTILKLRGNMHLGLRKCLI
jgi:hypothetical protein